MMMMQEPVTDVAPIEVRLPRLPPAASEEAFSVIRLDIEDLEGRQRLDMALSQAPGTSLFRRTTSLTANPTTQGVSLRSIAPSGAGRALVTLDGAPQNDPFGGWVIWASLPPELIEGVTLVRGGGSGPYGAGALTGVVQLEERSGEGLIADVRAGSLGSRRGALVAEKSFGLTDVMLGVSAGETDGFIPVREGRGAADAKLSEEDWSGALRIAGSLGSGRFSARVAAYDEQRESGLVGAAARAKGSSATLTFGEGPTDQRVGYRLQAWVRESDLQNSSVAVAADRSATTPANDQFATPTTGYGVNGALRGAGLDHEWELGVDARAASGETQELFRFMGGEFTRQRIAGGDVLVAGAYAEGTLKREDWIATGGLRLDYWSSSDAKRIETNTATGAVTFQGNDPDRDGWLPTARAGVRRDFGGLFVRGAAYVGFRPPTLNELHRPFRVGNDITEANSALEPERLFGVEAATGLETDNSRLSVTIFANQLEDAVTNVTIAEAVGGVVPGFESAGFIPANGSLRQRRNAGTIEAVGIEAEYERRFSDTLSGYLAGSYTEAEVDGGTQAPQLTGLRPAQAPRMTLTAGADWQATDRLSLGLRGRYESARFEDDLNSRELPAGGMVDVQAAFEVREGLEIYAIGENILDEDLATGVTGGGVVSYGPPRTYAVGLRFRR